MPPIDLRTLFLMAGALSALQALTFKLLARATSVRVPGLRTWENGTWLI